MGIDIRDGQQLECITCALCVDACDDVMTRLGKERGLISYATLGDYNANMALATGNGKVVQPSRVRDPATGKLVDAIRRTSWRSIIRPRTIAYLIGFAAIGMAMLTALALRSPLSLNVLHDRNPLYVELRDGSVRNGYDVKVLNMTPEPREVVLSLEGLPGATIALAEGEGDAGSIALALEPDKVLPLRLYVRVGPKDLPASQSPLTIVVEDRIAGLSRSVTSTFEVPEPRK
jgi:polyferredoxin